MNAISDKPRHRVPAGSSAFTSDSFVNWAANLGYGAQNLSSASTYELAPISRNHYRLEMMYRGSWLVRQIVDSVAEDMTRAGIQLDTVMPPDDEAKLLRVLHDLQVWSNLQATVKWSRLYGGALAIPMIDGQDTASPLRLETVGRDQFKGLMVLDRWMLTPHLEDTVRELGPNFGLPRYYDVVSDARSVPTMRIHYSRCIRFNGAELPYWQRMAENLWGLSIIEPMLDRMIAFDSATAGAAQLVHKAHLRTMSIEKYRDIIAAGGKTYQALKEQLGLIRLMQSIEGMTVIDKSDEFTTHQYAFGGLSDVLVQFGQQLSGASGIPLVRLFGQSPAGMNATGESDLRNYYDMVNAQQEAKLRSPLMLLLDIAHRSCFGRPVPAGFSFSFRPLWQLREQEKAQISQTLTSTVLSAVEASLIGPKVALKELREHARATGVWSNITDELIDQADESPPDPMAAMDPAGGQISPLGEPQGEPNGLPPAAPAPAAPPAAPDASGLVGQGSAPAARRRPLTRRRLLVGTPAQQLERFIQARTAKRNNKSATIVRLFEHDEFNPSEPRDPEGKWTEGGGGTGRPPKTKPASAQVSPVRVLGQGAGPKAEPVATPPEFGEEFLEKLRRGQSWMQPSKRGQGASHSSPVPMERFERGDVVVNPTELVIRRMVSRAPYHNLRLLLMGQNVVVGDDSKYTHAHMVRILQESAHPLAAEAKESENIAKRCLYLNYKNDQPRLQYLSGHAIKPQNWPPAVQRLFGGKTHDQRAVVDIHGLTCIIETQKGEARGSHSMPCAYGYISGTSSAEGPHEQMDCFIGDDYTADKVFVVHQHKLDGGFDEHKCMLGFADEQTARNVYYQAFNDGGGPQRLHKLVTMTVPQFKRWLRTWKYGKAA